jgi:hypothetical protein
MFHDSFGSRIAASLHVSLATGCTIFAQIKAPETWTPVICSLIGLGGLYMQLVYQDKKDKAKAEALRIFVRDAVAIELAARLRADELAIQLASQLKS